MKIESLSKTAFYKESLSYKIESTFRYEILLRNGKALNPFRKPKEKEYLVFFNIVWSNDTSLMAATHFGGPSNQFKDYCFRIQFKNPTIEDFDYCYIVMPYFWARDEFKNYLSFENKQN
jgi:hypothetical protein